MEHTKTPWLVEKLGKKHVICTIHEPIANMMGDNEEANAAFIVKAVNSHDKLVLAAQALSAILDVKIVETPTGELRNEYCDMNINIKQLLLDIQK